AETIKGLPRDINVDYRAGTLKQIHGIGDAIAAKIGEIIETGQLRLLQRLEAEVPAGVAEMMRVPEVGPKSAMIIYQTLGLEGIDRLEAAARAGQLQQVPGIGAKTEARILAGIEALRRRSDRSLLGVVLPRTEALLAGLYDQVGKRILRAEMAGSLRRCCATIGDIDLLVAAASDDAPAIMEAFRKLPQVGEIVGAGDTRTAVRLHSGEQVDLRVIEPQHWGCALQYFTGSQQHNIRVRELAQARGLSLNEYRFRRDDGEEIFCESEREVYEQLGLPWIPPELREKQGEFEAAREGALPDLVEIEDLRGDLHMHSEWSDGKSSILEMAQAARARGYEYIVITDHSQSLAMTGGLSPERLVQQRYE
ncbi:MAG: helix-hairpin-helix domain-containing protein, partial [Ardenticatenaceae bacterium]